MNPDALVIGRMAWMVCRAVSSVSGSSAFSMMASSCCELRPLWLGTSASGERTALAPNRPVMKISESMPIAMASAR